MDMQLAQELRASLEEFLAQGSIEIRETGSRIFACGSTIVGSAGSG